MTGSPAPTVASRKTDPAPGADWASTMFFHSSTFDEKPFLFGVTTESPEEMARGYSSVTERSEVQSMRMVCCFEERDSDARDLTTSRGFAAE